MLEERYASILADQSAAVPPLEGEVDPVAEETKLVEAALAESITKLIRQFSKRDNQVLLKTFDIKLKEEIEILSFMDSWGKLRELVNVWMTTS